MPDKRFRIPSVELHLLRSAHVGQTFQIQVMQPLLGIGREERFPALYMTDANLGFDLAKGVTHCLQVTGQVRRFIVVAIGYPGDNPFAGNILRFRDMTSRLRTEFSGLPRSSPLEGVAGIDEGTPHWGGAAKFLAFIRHELIPFIDRQYPTVQGDRAYFGHSLGGGFGLHALFQEADLFNRYVISSPGLSADGDDHGIEEARAFVKSGPSCAAKVVMSVGAEEEWEAPRAQFVSSAVRLASLLRQANVPGLDLAFRIYPGETHLSVYPISFSHGVQAIFGRAEAPPMAGA